MIPDRVQRRTLARQRPVNGWRRMSVLIGALTVSNLLAPLVHVQQAHAAPKWCRAWHVSGQTWYASQSNGFTLLFTLRSTPGSTMFNGFARYERGDVNLGGTPSQLLRGSVQSEGAGGVIMNIVWRGGQSGQYIGSVVNVQRTPTGMLTAGLQGTTVDTTGSGVSARWEADGFSSGIGTSDVYRWPLYCPQSYVVQPDSPTTTKTTTAAVKKVISAPAKQLVTTSKPKRLVKRATTIPSTALPSTTVPAAAPAPTPLAPAVARVTAVDDVDVYNGPGGTFNVVAVMAAGTSANVLARHADGWCLLDGLGPAGTGWVAEDHLKPRRCGAG